MKISVQPVLDIAGERIAFQSELNLGWIKRHGKQVFPKLLAVSGEANNRAGVVVLRYQIEGGIPFECDRCLMQTERVVDKEFVHTVVRQASNNETDDAFIIAPDGVLDIEEIAGVDLQLELPQVFLCKEDCKGLCPVCGTDLNYNNCGCQSDSTDPRLQKLRNLLKD